MSKQRFRLHKTTTIGLYKSHIFCSDVTFKQYIVFMYRDLRYFEIWQVNPVIRVYKSRTIRHLDNLQRLLKKRLLKLKINVMEEAKRTRKNQVYGGNK